MSGATAATPLLAVGLGRLLLDLHDQQALGLAVAEDRLDGQRHLGMVAVARPRRGQFGSQLGQGRRRPLDPLVSRQRIEFGLAGGVVPGQAVSLDGDRLGLMGAVTVDQLALVAELVVDVFPAGQAFADGRAEGRVLAPEFVAGR